MNIFDVRGYIKLHFKWAKRMSYKIFWDHISFFSFLSMENFTTVKISPFSVSLFVRNGAAVVVVARFPFRHNNKRLTWLRRHFRTKNKNVDDGPSVVRCFGFGDCSTARTSVSKNEQVWCLMWKLWEERKAEWEILLEDQVVSGLKTSFQDELSRRTCVQTLQGVVRVLLALQGLRRRCQGHPISRVQEVWRHQV